MAKDYTITDNSRTDETGKVYPMFTVKWGTTVQNFKSREDAEKFCKNHGNVDRSVRQVRKDANKPKDEPKAKDDKKV